MNLDRLRLFLKIVDTGSVTAASRQAHLTQPAASRALRQLEEEVGAELFARDGRRVLLTAAGRALVPEARELVHAADRAQLRVRRAASAAFFDLRIGSVDSLGAYLLPQVLRELEATYSNLRIKLWMARTQELLERVEHGTLDIALVAYSGPPSERASRVGDYQLQYFGLRERFPHLDEVSSEAEIQTLPLIELQALPGQPSSVRPDADAFFIVQNLSAVKALVMSGMGIGQLLPFMLSDAEKRMLVKGEHLPHDPVCGVYCVRGQRQVSETEQQMLTALEALMRSALASAEPRKG